MQPPPDLATLFDALDDGQPFDLARARDGIAAMLTLIQVTVPVDSVEDGTLGGVPVRTYQSDDAGEAVLVWLHGGGWVTGGLDAADGLCRDLAVRTRTTVVSVDYRLAPEHPFPAALEDVLAVLAALPPDVPLVLGGDSAGGNLAAAAAQAVPSRVAVQVLVSPLLDATLSSPSVAELATGHGLTRELLQRVVALYAQGAQLTDPRLSPLHAPDLSGLPPAVVVTAGRDPLCDEGEAYAARLRDAGVPVRARRWDAMVHGFHGMAAFTACADEAVDWVAASLADLLRG